MLGCLGAYGIVLNGTRDKKIQKGRRPSKAGGATVASGQMLASGKVDTDPTRGNRGALW